MVYLLSACFENKPSKRSITDDTTVLTINDEKINFKQFKKELAGQKKIFRIHNSQELKPEELIWIKNRVLDEIVKNTLLKQELARNNITVDQKEIDQALNIASEGYYTGSLEKSLKLEGVSIEDWRISIKNKLLINKLIRLHVNSKVSVSDKELHDYYKKANNKFHKKEQVRALHIMVESEEEIREIQNELRQKNKLFSDLAKEFSLGPEGVQGGDLGYFETGQMPEEFDEVFKLKKNMVSSIIRSPYGFHLFKVMDKVKERKMNFIESKNKIEKIILQDKQDIAFRKWLLKLKRNAHINFEYDLLQIII